MTADRFKRIDHVVDMLKHGSHVVVTNWNKVVFAHVQRLDK